MANVKELTSAQIADKWAQITVKEWRQKIVNLKVVNKSQLWMSFLKNVVAKANGDLIKIEFSFLYYGKFVDMGVGRGVKISDVREVATSRRLEGKMLGNRRKPKKWYSKTLQANIYRLAELLGQEYASVISSEIVENIADNSIKGGAR